MTAQVIPFPQRPPVDDYFGVCPTCKRNDGYVNLGAEHWFFCDRHRTKWTIGSNIFEGWRHESQSLWYQNALRLQHYKEITPWRSK